MGLEPTVTETAKENHDDCRIVSHKKGDKDRQEADNKEESAGDNALHLRTCERSFY